MSLAIVQSRAMAGVDAPLVTVEVYIGKGLPGLSIVGLPEAAVKESKDRVRSAILNSGFTFPVGRITVNLAPADLPKEGGRFDLPIALGLLAASEQIPVSAMADMECLGELALSGRLRPVRGALPAVLHSRDAGRFLMLPQQNSDEAALVSDARVLPVNSLAQCCQLITGQTRVTPVSVQRRSPAAAADLPDMADIRGQFQAKRALLVAAAGSHSLLFVGPPGTGKTMLASRLPGILPPMSEREALESAAIASISDQGFDAGKWCRRPFRNPHHTASAVALVGGGSNPRPGEISLAHNGVLFLDELPEFSRQVLEVLREPLESGSVSISRAARQAKFQARFQLVAAMNPCPCGYLGHVNGRCNCTADQVQRYQGKLSGPLLDRIDLHVIVPPLSYQEMTATLTLPSVASATLREQVIDARTRQLERAGILNAHLQAQQLQRDCCLDEQQNQLLAQAVNSLGLSARAIHRILRIARTIADLDGSRNIGHNHLGEAIGYRQLDRSA